MKLRWLRLVLATKLLGFMKPNTCLAFVLRSNGDAEWDGGLIVAGRFIVPIGLSAIVGDE